MTTAAPVRLIDAKEVAGMYGISPRTVKRWRRLGLIPSPQVDRGTFVRWLLSDVEQHILGMKRAEKEQAA